MNVAELQRHIFRLNNKIEDLENMLDAIQYKQQRQSRRMRKLERMVKDGKGKGNSKV